ncbi:MAG: ribonuclease III [Defluviitaleaceae bacterium]|nr:ribonuclease III [Defluviitaleaceae bacterium]
MQNNLPNIPNYVFKNPKLLQRALTHSSFMYENLTKAPTSNERLEFLGDAVLELVISDLLYHQYKNLAEGDLSKSRALLVCEESLAAHAKTLKLGDFLLLGRGETADSGAEKNSILSDALEAVIAAIYLDGGINSARLFIEHLFLEETENGRNLKAPPKQLDNPKSILQEKVQRFSDIPLRYKVVDETGPDHQKHFTISVYHNEKPLGTGTGKTKKIATRNAAANALDNPELDVLLGV